MLLARAPASRHAARPAPAGGVAGPSRSLTLTAALSTRLPSTHEAASKEALAALKAAPAAVNRELPAAFWRIRPPGGGEGWGERGGLGRPDPPTRSASQPA